MNKNLEGKRLFRLAILSVEKRGKGDWLLKKGLEFFLGKKGEKKKDSCQVLEGSERQKEITKKEKKRAVEVDIFFGYV